MNEAKHISDLFAAYLDSYPYEAATRDCRAMWARGCVTLSEDGYAETIVGLVRQAMAQGRPFSIVRYGDGEGNLMASMLDDFQELRAWARSRLLVNMFGRDDFTPDACDRLARLITSSVLDADVLGVRTPGQLLRPYHAAQQGRAEGRRIKFVRGLLGSLDSVRCILLALETADRRPPAVADCDLSRALLPRFADLLEGLDFVGVIGRSAVLGPAIERTFGVATCRVYETPPQSKGEFVSDHYPQVFDQICEEAAPPYPGALFLVGAGVLGKAYCSMLRAKGAVVIDVGSVFDIWLGETTRRRLSTGEYDCWRIVDPSDLGGC